MSMPSHEAASYALAPLSDHAVRIGRSVLCALAQWLALCLLVAGCAQGRLPGVPNAAAPLAVSSKGSAPDFRQMAKIQGPAVVNVVATRTISHQDLTEEQMESLDEAFRRYAMDPPAEVRGQMLASGVIIDADGYVLTNAHAVDNAEDVTVRLSDAKRDLKARVLGSDARSDIALLKIDAHDLPSAVLGSSSSLEVGEWVVAIGSPFGFDNTVTAGIVSAKDRVLPDEAFVSFIQTQVPLNPGSSGGPLLNARGQVVGINSRIYSRTGGYMGMSFAIPIEVAIDIGKQLREQGKVTRGQLGVRTQVMTDELAQSFGLESPRGALIAAVQVLSPAEKAGLQSGDVVLRYQDKTVEDANTLPRMVAQTRPGTHVNLAIWRDRGERQIDALIGELEPAMPPKPRVLAKAEVPAQPDTNRLGLQLAQLDAAQAHELGSDHGLLVQAVSGSASHTPIRSGDVILALNGTSVHSVEQFNQHLAPLPSGHVVALLVLRGREAVYMPIRVGEAS